MRKSYHHWLLNQQKSFERGDPSATASTDELLDKMEDFFKEPRHVLKEIIGAWDGTPESVGE